MQGEDQSVKPRLLLLVKSTKQTSRDPTFTALAFTAITRSRQDFRNEGMLLEVMTLVSTVMLTREMRVNEEIIAQGTQVLMDLAEIECVAPLEVFTMIAWVLSINNKGNRRHIFQLHMVELLEHVLKVCNSECHEEGHSLYECINGDIAKFLEGDFAIGPVKDCVDRINLHNWLREGDKPAKRAKRLCDN